MSHLRLLRAQPAHLRHEHLRDELGCNDTQVEGDAQPSRGDLRATRAVAQLNGNQNNVAVVHTVAPLVHCWCAKHGGCTHSLTRLDREASSAKRSTAQHSE